MLYVCDSDEVGLGGIAYTSQVCGNKQTQNWFKQSINEYQPNGKSSSSGWVSQYGNLTLYLTEEWCRK